MMPPRIALNASLIPAESQSPSVTIKVTYTDSILRAGGAPLVLPPIENLSTLRCLLAQADGLVAIGGADIDPARYAAAPSPLTVPLHPRREAFDFAVLAEALALGLPVLGICLGCQVLNVHYGGTLWQDLLAEQPDSTVRHSVKVGSGAIRHPVEAQPGTLLSRIVGPEELEVNSSHHQGIRAVGRGLVASARSPDGLIEAIEDPSRPFVLGVQWHPENLAGEPRHEALFASLVEAAARARE